MMGATSAIVIPSPHHKKIRSIMTVSTICATQVETLLRSHKNFGPVHRLIAA